jgi:alcohol dehydrogenase class IV
MSANIEAIQQRDPESRTLQRYTEIGKTLTGKRDATASDGVEWVQELCTELKVPALSTYGFSDRDIPTMIEKASAASSMKGNPIELTSGEMNKILEGAM